MLGPAVVDREALAVDVEVVAFVDADCCDRVVVCEQRAAHGERRPHGVVGGWRLEQRHPETHEGPEHGQGSAPLRAERVAVASTGRVGVDGLDEALLGHRAQALAQHGGGDAGKVALQVAEALRASAQLAHDQQRPAIAQHVERAGDGAVLLVISDRRRHGAACRSFVV